ncbi:MAG: PVC-type heme-binding CxxCH protein [Bacteroidota bacterium]
MRKFSPLFPLLIFLSCMILYSCEGEQSSLPDGFEIHPDFQLTLVASEPLIFDPVDMKFDEFGQAFVLEMPGYPLRDEDSRIILLTDNNQDGTFDNRQVYADGLGVASSFLPYKGGMLVAAPPHLLFLKDTDGDGKSDQRDIIMEGFEVGNLQHNFNGLTYGLDNMIYAANGGNNGAPYFAGDSSSKLSLRGEDFRFDIEKKILERVGESSGGFELAFDDWGHMYETHNLEHVSHLVFESKYLDGLPTDPAHALSNVSDHEENGLSRIYPIGEQETRVNHPEQSGYFSGACGITYYGGNAFPEGFNDNLFVCDVVLNLIHMDVLSQDKASFKASRKREKAEFLASSDRAFRPVNMRTGPDGALYLMDMHRDVIEHPEWIPDEIEATQDLSAGKEKGRIYRIFPIQGTPSAIPVFNKDKAKDLLLLLGDENQWTRTTAQRLLVEKNPVELVPDLEQILESQGISLARLHAMWTLEGMSELSHSSLVKALKDASDGVQENAIKIAEKRLNQHPDLIPLLIEIIDKAETNPRVQMQAILALSRLDDQRYKEFAESFLFSLTNALAGEGTDIWTSMAVASAVQRQPAIFCELLLNGKFGPITEARLTTATTLSRLIGKDHRHQEADRLLGFMAGTEIMDEPHHVAMLEAMAEGWAQNQTVSRRAASLQTALDRLEAGKRIAVLRASGHLRQTMGLAVSAAMRSQLNRASKLVFASSLSTEERLEYLRLYGLDKFSRRKMILLDLIDSKHPLDIQQEALRQLWEADDTDIASHLLELWPTLGPEARKSAGNILLYKRSNHDLLLTALEEGKINPGELNLDLERRRVLLFSKNESVKSRAEALFSDAGVVQRKEAIEGMRPALSLAGNATNGQQVFTTLCSNCHQYGSLGKEVGPVLTEIHRKSKESLLHEILDPNAGVDPKYLNHQVRTKDGNIYTGMVYRETDSEVSLRMMGGTEQTISKSNIEELSSLGISLMPEGLEGSMSQEEMADLLAFLQQPSS